MLNLNDFNQLLYFAILGGYRIDLFSMYKAEFSTSNEVMHAS